MTRVVRGHQPAPSLGEVPTRPGGRWRVPAFVAVCALSVTVAVGYAIHAAKQADRSRPSRVAGGGNLDDIAGRLSGPQLGYVGTGYGAAFATFALVPLGSPSSPPAATGIDCMVAHASGGKGLCLDVGLFSYEATVFDQRFRPLHELRLGGLPSRVRVAPGGRLAAATVFVSGHSYAVAGFSTATTLIDLDTGHTLANLEEFATLRDGRRFHSPDFNFWGVTFADANRFYATLGTAGKTYLVQGDVAQRTATVLRDNVECPSLSPDGTRLVFKKQVSRGFGPVRWRLHVLDLETLEDRPLAEERSVDDQAEWLDGRRVAYTVPRDAPSAVTDTWVVPVDGDERPHVLIKESRSPVKISDWPGMA